MNIDDLRNRIMHKVYEKAERIVEQRAQTLKALLRYEIGVANTELALYSNDHGYDFHFISNSYADNIVVSPAVLDNGSITMSVTIPNHAYKDASDSEINFFKTFILSNAIKKLNQGH